MSDKYPRPHVVILQPVRRPNADIGILVGKSEEYLNKAGNFSLISTPLKMSDKSAITAAFRCLKEEVGLAADQDAYLLTTAVEDGEALIFVANRAVLLESEVDTFFQPSAKWITNDVMCREERLVRPSHTRALSLWFAQR